MPWTVEDVEKHKKGLSDAEKKKWVSVANSVLKKCKEKDGDTKECEASAIRQANGSVGTNEGMEKINLVNNNYQKRYAVHQGRRHLIVPVVMMVEGVHHGSHGPLLHRIEQLGRFPQAWNGMPIVVNHPADKDGNDVSANSPDVLDQEIVGRIYNTHVEGEKLRAEAWLDVVRLYEKSDKSFRLVEDQKPLNVSLGVFSDERMEQGQWNGEFYERAAYNHRPDHLAILPETSGACSLEDGCGINVNVEENKNEGGQKMTRTRNDGKASKEDKVKSLIENNERFTDKDAEWLNTLSDEQVDKLLPDEPDNPCCPDKVDELIKNEKSPYKEEDRDRLLKLDATTLDELFPKKKEVDDKKGGPETNKKDDKKEEPKITGQMLANALKEHIKKPEDFLGLMPEEMKEMYESGLKLHREKRAGMIEGIISNTEKFTKEELQKMDNDLLEKLHDSITPQEDFTLLGGEPTKNEKNKKDESKKKKLYPIEVLEAERRKKEQNK